MAALGHFAAQSPCNGMFRLRLNPCQQAQKPRLFPHQRDNPRHLGPARCKSARFVKGKGFHRSQPLQRCTTLEQHPAARRCRQR